MVSPKNQFNEEKRKQSQRDASRRYHLKNKEKRAAYRKKIYHLNRDEAIASVKAYYQSHKEEVKAKARARRKIYYQKNRDKIIKQEIERSKNKYALNTEFRLLERIRGETRDRFTKEESCGVCGSKEHLEFHHWVYKRPVERKHFSTLCAGCHEIMHHVGGFNVIV